MPHIIIRSSDRHSSSPSTASARFMLSPGIRFPERKEATKLKLEYAQVYNTVYNIQTGINAALFFAEPTFSYSHQDTTTRRRLQLSLRAP